DQAEKEAGRKRKERKKAFEAIAKLPRLAHEARLAELAKRSGEDLDFLRDEFAAYGGPDPGDSPLEPWDEPVETAALLTELIAQGGRDDGVGGELVLRRPHVTVL